MSTAVRWPRRRPRWLRPASRSRSVSATTMTCGRSCWATPAFSPVPAPGRLWLTTPPHQRPSPAKSPRRPGSGRSASSTRPVSGGQAGAENGLLTIMVGGERETFGRALPTLEAYASYVRLLGPSGSGQLAKMVNQVCIAGVVQGLAEGLLFAERAGLDSAAVIDVISRGAAGSWQMENRHRTMLDGEYEHGFAVDWMRKDPGYCAGRSRAIGTDAARGRPGGRFLRRCAGHGWRALGYVQPAGPAATAQRFIVGGERCCLRKNSITGCSSFSANRLRLFTLWRPWARHLAAAGFTRLEDAETWDLDSGGRYYLTRNDSSIIAFIHGGDAPPRAGMRMLGAHTDSPGPDAQTEPGQARPRVFPTRRGGLRGRPVEPLVRP